VTPRKIAVVGGECTGKTVLCQALARDLPGLWVPEALREFVDRQGRVPRLPDQAAIMKVQIDREVDVMSAAAREGAAWVACDSAPVATALYSAMYFGDRSLDALAEKHHATYTFTLLTDIDLPWEPDGVQRDGPAVQAEFDARILDWLNRGNVPFARIGGIGAERIRNAVAALRGLQSAAR
jgi:nicotinamide riboside kinase